MKKLTLILLLIPILNNSQTLEDFCFIDSIDLFKRYATEYNYEKVTENDDYISYALEPVGKEDPETMLSIGLTMYLPKQNILSWAFDMTNFDQEYNYNAMYNSVKGNWKYLKITEVGGTDYVTYESVCNDGKDGSSPIQLGFAITDGVGTIVRF